MAPGHRNDDVTSGDEHGDRAWRHHPGEAAKPTDLVEETRATIDEARVVLPGIQALFGFQFVAIFNQTFQELEPFQKHLHLAALLLVAIAVAFIMAPAAYHRLAHRGAVSKRFVDIASALIAWALLPVMLAIVLDAYVVSLIITDSTPFSVAAAAALLVLFTGMWFVLPLRERGRKLPVRR